MAVPHRNYATYLTPLTVRTQPFVSSSKVPSWPNPRQLGRHLTGARLAGLGQ